MIVGFCGSGNMAAAMARGLRGEVEQMLFTDAGSGRAVDLAAEVGGRAAGSNRGLAEGSDVVVLAMKPAGLDRLAAEIGDIGGPVVSLLAATSLDRVAAAFPDAAVCRVMPNLAVEVRRGVLCLAGSASEDVRGMLEALGRVVELADSDFDVATALMGCTPAYLALAAEALAEAGAEAGIEEGLAAELVAEAMAGTAELLRRRGAADVRRAVASPGGSTEAGLNALDREGARAAFTAAVAASLERMRG
jgi:pyrroline-5-carboxylate reductase